MFFLAREWRVVNTHPLPHFPTAEISTSQSDVQGGLLYVDGGRKGSCVTFSSQKSLSDTDINKSSRVSAPQRAAQHKKRAAAKVWVEWYGYAQ